MNPTEYFIERLVELLSKHEAETGTYIERIGIDRINAGLAHEIRNSCVIGEIVLEIK